MPAIAGLVSSAPGPRCQGELDVMLGSLCYEPHFDVTSFASQDLGLYVGWTTDGVGRAQDRQPAAPRPSVALILCGELTHAPSCSGSPSVDTACHLSYVGDALESACHQQGVASLLRGLNGTFVGVVADMSLRNVWVFNDRYGARRLFVRHGAEGVYFASEAKALLALMDDDRSFDPDGVAEFLAAGCTFGTRSLFRGIEILPGGSLWRVTPHGVASKTAYFTPDEWERRSPLSADKFRAEFLDQGPGIIRRYSEASAPVAVSATGGLDSRMILACLSQSRHPVPCYTFGSMYRPTYDVTVARAVTGALGFPHTVFTLGEEFLRTAAASVERAVYCSDGYIGLSGAAELYLNSLARTIAPYRLTGNFGSELLRGARAFKAGSPPRQLLSTDCARRVRDAEERFSKLTAVPPLSFTLFHQVPHQGYGRRNIEASQVRLRTPFLDNELAALMYLAPKDGLDRLGYELSVALVQQEASFLAGIPTDRGQLGAAGLRHAIVRATRELSFKAEYWVSHGMRRSAAHVLRLFPVGSIEHAYLGRHKFQHFGRWCRTELAGYLRSQREVHPAVSPYVSRGEWATAVSDQVAGRTNVITDIDSILTLNIAADVLLGRGAPRLLRPPRSTTRASFGGAAEGFRSTINITSG